MIRKNVTFTAQWAPATYTITYNMNGHGTAPSTTDTYTYGTGKSSLPNPAAVTGYTFGGWYKESGCTNQVTSISSTETGSKTFYAKWTPYRYSVCYRNKANTATLYSDAYDYDQTFSLRGAPTASTGHTAKGWATSANQSAATSGYGFGATGKKNLTSTNGGTVYLYLAEAANTYYVDYYNKAGTIKLFTDICTYGVEFSLRSSPTASTGHTTKGWATSKNQSAATSGYGFGAKKSNLTATAGGTVTLYLAEEANTYYVDYYNKAGTTKLFTDTCTYGVEFSLRASPTASTGHTTKGWATSANQSAATSGYGFGAKKSNLTATAGGTVVLYLAEEANTYYVDYYNKAGTTKLFTDTCTYGVEFSLRASPTASIGHTTKGWATSANQSGATSGYGFGAKKSNLATSGVVVLYLAEEANQYNLTLKTLGKDGKTWSTSTSKYSYGQTMTLSYMSGVTGWDFDGWYSDEGFKTKVTSPSSTTLKDLTFYARWVAHTHKVSFDANGGTGGQKDPVTATYDSAWPAISKEVPKKDGYQFTGWYQWTYPTGNLISSQRYTDKCEPIGTFATDTDVTLHAQWSRLPFNAISLTDERLGTGTKSIWYWPGKGYTPTDVNGLPVDGSRDNEIKLVKKSDANPNIVTAPSVTDYKFLGYYDEDGNKKIDENGNLLTDEVITGATTWCAKWERLGATVELKASYGDMVAEDIVQNTDKIEHVAFEKTFATTLDGKSVTEIVTPTRVGYTFMGYYTEENPELSTEDVKEGNFKGELWIYGEKEYDEDVQSGDLVAEKWFTEEEWAKASTNLVDKGAVVLYAAWQLDDCIVTFDEQTIFDEDGKAKENIEEVVVPEGSTALDDRIWHYNKSMTDKLPVPGEGTFSRNGYDFGGWYYLKDGKTETRVCDKEGNPANVLLPWKDDIKEVTLYAYWTPKTYTLEFDPNFPNVEGVAKIYEGETEVKLAYDDKLTLVDPDFGAYDFAGWYVYAGTDEEQAVLYGDSLADIHMTDGRFTPRGDLVKQFDPATIKIVAKWTEPEKRYIHLYAGLPEQGVDESTRVYEPQFYKFATAYAFPEDWLPERVNGWSCKGWVEVEDEEEALEYLKSGYVGDEKDRGITGIEAKVTRADYHDIYLVAKWTICPLSVTLTTVENDDGTYVKGTDGFDGDIEADGARAWNEVSKEERAYTAVYDVRDSSFTLPDISRRGYDFQGWRLQGTQDAPVKRLVVTPSEQAKVEADYERVYEPVFEVIEYTIILDPNAAELERKEHKVRFTDEFTFPYPVALNTGAVFSSWATKRMQPLEDDGSYLEFYQAQTVSMAPGMDENGDPTFCLTDLTTDAERTIVLYAKYNGSYKVDVPLVANMAIDTETGDVVPGRTRLETTKDDAVYTVESMRYEPVTDDNGHVPFQGASEVYFSVYPGLTFQNTQDSYYFLQKAKVGEKGKVTYTAKGGAETIATPLLVKLGSTSATPKLFTKTSMSDDPNEVTLDSMTTDTTGFYSFSKDNPLDIYYGIHFADESSWKSTLQRYAFGKNQGGWELPENDAGNTTIYDYPTDDYRRGLGWSTNRVDIAKVRYTLSVQTKPTE